MAPFSIRKRGRIDALVPSLPGRHPQLETNIGARDVQSPCLQYVQPPLNSPATKTDLIHVESLVVLAISSSNRDPMNAMARLYERSNSNKLHASRPYMDPTVLRFFLVVHDNAEGTDLEE
jgi:hypothetical protein